MYVRVLKNIKNFFFIKFSNYLAYLSYPNSNPVNEERLLHVQIDVGFWAKELHLLRGEITTDLKNIVQFYEKNNQISKDQIDKIFLSLIHVYLCLLTL